MFTNRTKACRLLFTPAAAACLVVAIAGCASPRQTAKPADVVVPAPVPQLPPAVAALIEAGKQEERHPSAAASTAPPPEGIDPSLAQALTGDKTRARTSLAKALSEAPKPTEASRPADADPDKQGESLRHYVQGRQMLLAGEAARAAAELKTATELDPAAGEPWRELGEAQLAQGLTGEAITSFRAAVAAGLREPRTLELLGRAALERADYVDATRYLAAALEANPDRADPALSRLILVELSRAFAPQGYIVAAKEAIEQALTSPAQVSASTRYSAELGAIFRRQGELWRDVGDAMCRLGEYPEAVAAYVHSADLPTVDGRPIMPRIVFAWMRAGRPSSAAGSVLAGIIENHGRVGPPEVALLKHITAHGGDARLIADAIGSLKSGGGHAIYPSLERGLTLAQAAILPGEAGASVLRAYVENHPTDVRASFGLLESMPDAGAAANEAARLAGQNAFSAKAIAEALLQTRFEVAPMMESLRSAARADGALLVMVYITAKQGRFEEALSLTEGIHAAGSASAAVLNARAEVAAILGKPEVIADAIGRIKASPDPMTTRLRANCLVLAQHFREALETLRPLLSGPVGPETVADLSVAGDIALRIGRVDEAEQLISRAAQLDPYDDGPASLLLVLYSAGGQRPDTAKLTRAVRSLRQNIPDSRTLRLVRARETMRRSQWTQTEAELRQLCQEDPGDAASMELLASTWTGRLKVEPAAGDDARAWLDSMIARRPQSPVLLSASTTLEIARGHAAEAVAPLKAALANGAGPDVSRVLEQTLRVPLGKMTEADGFTAARLARQPLTFQWAIEAAEFKTRTGHAEEAIGTLYESLTPDVDIAREQAGGLLTLVGLCVDRIKDPGNTVAFSAAAAIFDRLLTVQPQLPIEAHQRRIEAMTCCLDCSVPALLDAVKLCVEQHPSLQTRPYIIASLRLRNLRRAEAAMEFITKALGTNPADTDLLHEWFIVVYACGTSEDARPMIEAIHAAGKLRTVLERIGEPQVLLRAEDQSDLRSDAAYFLGTLYTSARKTAQAEAALELALSYNPRHAWASNDLGYVLADRGVDMDRASRLLELAAEKLPKEGSVLDSLGWLRYKQGVILDETDPQTGLLKRRGALSLLETAARTANGQSDFTIQDHLGDARWLAGKKDEAIQGWTAAGELSRAHLVEEDLRNKELRQGAPEPAARVEDSAQVVEARTLDASTKAKIEAAKNGQTVHVAPQINAPDPQPATAEAAPQNPAN